MLLHNKLQTWFVFNQDQILIQQLGECYQLPQYASIPKWLGELASDYILNDSERVGYLVQRPSQVPEQYEWVALKQAFELLGGSSVGRLAKAYQLISWQENHRYCHQCGHALLKSSDRLSHDCSYCEKEFYPQIAPSVIVLIQKGEEILMVKQPHYKPGIYGLVAGFIESGENAEEAVHREVKEEVGIEIRNIRYFGSQAWPFPNNLMFGYLADYADGEITLPDGELDSAQWFDVQNLPGYPSSSHSIARQMIDWWSTLHTQGEIS